MKRQDAIVEWVSQKRKVSVNELADHFQVSKVTIRKDLDRLEERGILSRQHGYAVVSSSADMNYRLAVNYDLKHRIAKRAAAAIHDGDTVMIESGGTCALLAEILAFENRDITIITNSTFIASFVRKSPSVKLILLGGEYQKDSQVCVGPFLREIASYFQVQHFFMGMEGFDLKKGFTGVDVARIDAARTLAESAQEINVLMDSSKFTNSQGILQFRLEEVDRVYTDSGIPQNIAQALEQAGVDLVQVPAEEE